FILGREKEREWISGVSSRCGMPIVSTTAAVLEAINHFSARTVYLITPYVDSVNTHIVSFLEASDISVSGISSFRVPDTRDVAKIPSEKVAELTISERANIGKSDLVFISCTNLLTMDQIELIE